MDRLSEVLFLVQRNLRSREMQRTPLSWWDITALQGWPVVRRRLCEALNWGSYRRSLKDLSFPSETFPLKEGRGLEEGRHKGGISNSWDSEPFSFCVGGHSPPTPSQYSSLLIPQRKVEKLGQEPERF